MPDWLDELELDEDDLKEAIIIFCVLLLLTLLAGIVVCYLRWEEVEKLGWDLVEWLDRCASIPRIESQRWQ
jgi:hypothetical protein